MANAGIGAYGGIMSLTDDQIREIDATNFLGTVWSVRAAVPTLPRAGRRRRGDRQLGRRAARRALGGGVRRAPSTPRSAWPARWTASCGRHGIRVTAICPAAVSTEFAIGAGRNEGDAWLEDVLTAEDVAAAIVATLAQPRRLRTQQWVLRSMAEES